LVAPLFGSTLYSGFRASFFGSTGRETGLSSASEQGKDEVGILGILKRVRTAANEATKLPSILGSREKTHAAFQLLHWNPVFGFKYYQRLDMKTDGKLRIPGHVDTDSGAM
jgi:hypothetical protein